MLSRRVDSQLRYFTSKFSGGGTLISPIIPIQPFVISIFGGTEPLVLALHRARPKVGCGFRSARKPQGRIFTMIVSGPGGGYAPFAQNPRCEPPLISIFGGMEPPFPT